MKDQYVEKDGLLFMKCEPKPLKKDSEMPCLARLIQDNSRMGILNKVTHLAFPLSNSLSNIVISRLSSGYVMTIGADAHYTRFEIVGKLCPEGSVEWALWQMLNGKTVSTEHKDTFTYKEENGKIYHKKTTDNEWASDYACRYWARYTHADRWYIHEEPKPEIKIEQCKWYYYAVEDRYMYCTEVQNNGALFRSAGQEKSDRVIPPEQYGHLMQISIYPDFNNARNGDMCYSCRLGYTYIISVNKTNNPISIGVRDYPSDAQCYFRIDGREYPDDRHPTLFHTASQCAAYYAEESLHD